MSVEFNASGAMDAQRSEYVSCCEEWERPESVQRGTGDESGMEPAYHLPCAE